MLRFGAAGPIHFNRNARSMSPDYALFACVAVSAGESCGDNKPQTAATSIGREVSDSVVIELPAQASGVVYCRRLFGSRLLEWESDIAIQALRIFSPKPERPIDAVRSAKRCLEDRTGV